MRFVNWILVGCLWRCWRCCLNCYSLLGQRASASSFDHPFVGLPSLFLRVCLLCTRLSKHCSAVHSVVIACAGYIRLLFKLPLKFRNVFEHTEIRSSFACNQNSKEDIFTALEVFICFETKRNQTKPDPPRKHPRNARVISAEELGTMSKNNLRGITLVRGPTWGIHSLTLLISWYG